MDEIDLDTKEFWYRIAKLAAYWFSIDHGGAKPIMQDMQYSPLRMCKVAYSSDAGGATLPLWCNPASLSGAAMPLWCIITSVSGAGGAALPLWLVQEEGHLGRVR